MADVTWGSCLEFLYKASLCGLAPSHCGCSQEVKLTIHRHWVNASVTRQEVHPCPLLLRPWESLFQQYFISYPWLTSYGNNCQQTHTLDFYNNQKVFSCCSSFELFLAQASYKRTQDIAPVGTAGLPMSLFPRLGLQIFPTATLHLLWPLEVCMNFCESKLLTVTSLPTLNSPSDPGTIVSSAALISWVPLILRCLRLSLERSKTLAVKCKKDTRVKASRNFWMYHLHRFSESFFFFATKSNF